MKRIPHLLAAAAFLLLSSGLVHADAKPFFLDVDQTKTRATDVAFNYQKVDDDSVLKVSTAHAQPWPGVTLVSSKGHWNLSAFDRLLVDVKNTGANPVRVNCRVDNPEADGRKNCITAWIDLAPGKSGTLVVNLTRKPPTVPGVNLFGMRGYPIDMDSEGTINPGNINQILFFVAQPSDDHAFEVRKLRATGDYQIVPDDLKGKQFLPFIDTFGQYIHRDWPGKLHDVKEFADRIKDEERELTLFPGPPSWDKFGGWKDGPTLDANGFFRVQKYKDKWTLVDPEGRLFFSHGIDCVNNPNSTPIDERESWFADFPGKLPENKAFFSTSKGLLGHYADKKVQSFSFDGANLKRKYGDDWAKKNIDVIHLRLRSWAMNTIGNWSDKTTYLADRTPYVTSVWMDSRKIEGSKGYWGKFRDVFAPEFESELKKRVTEFTAKTVDDPWCIGYFVDNEMSWGDRTELAVATLASPADQPAKIAFVDDLKLKYKSIDALNAAWATKHASWDGLLKNQTPPEVEKARTDLEAFETRLCETYFKAVKEALHEAAPHHLYLGCRFSNVNPIAADAAAKFCDVVSFNLYRQNVADFKNPAKADVPIIIGEFHFGALDRGMFHPGLVLTASQEDRARHYFDYVRSAIDRPDCVGCHWFQYADEPTTGRALDGENYQIGFVDVTDTPYPETIAASRQAGAFMYHERFGE